FLLDHYSALNLPNVEAMASIAAFLGQVASLDGLRFEERIHFYEQISTRLQSKNLLEELAASSLEKRAQFWAQSLQRVVHLAHEDLNHLKKVSDQKGPQHSIVVRKKKAILDAIKRLFAACRTAGCAKNTEIVSFFVTILSDSSLRAMVGEDYASFIEASIFSCKEFVFSLSDALLESIHNSLTAKLKTKFCSQYLSLFSQLVLVTSERSCLFADVSVLANWLAATFQHKDERLFQRIVNSVDCLVKHEYLTVFFSKTCAFAESLFQCYEQFFSSFKTATHEVVLSFFCQFFSTLLARKDLQDSCKELVQELLLLRQPLILLLIRLREEKFIPSVRFHRADKTTDCPVFYRLLAVLSSSDLAAISQNPALDPALHHQNKRQRCASAIEEACDSIESVSADDVAVILDIKLIRALFESKNVPNTSLKRLQSTLIHVQKYHKDDVILSFLIRLVTDCFEKWNFQFDEDFMESFWKFSFNMMTRKNFRQLSFHLCQALSASYSGDSNISVLNWLLCAFELSLSVKPVSIQLKEFCHIADVSIAIVSREAPCCSDRYRKCYCLSDPTLIEISKIVESTIKDFKPSSFNEFVDITISSAFLQCCNLIENQAIVAQVLSSLLRTCETLRDKCDLFYFADQVGDFVKVFRPLINSVLAQPIKAFLLNAKKLFFDLLTTNNSSERDLSVLNLEDEAEFSPTCDDTLSANDYTSNCREVTINRQERLRQSLLKAYLRLTSELDYDNCDEVIDSLKLLAQGSSSSFSARNSDLHAFTIFLVKEFIQFSSTVDSTQQYIKLAFDVFRRGFREFRKNQPVIVQFCDIFAEFIEKLGNFCHDSAENYFNYCQELLVVIMLCQEGIACSTCLLKSWLECTIRVCKLRPSLLSRQKQGTTIFRYILEQLGHFCDAVATKAANNVRFVDWKDADHVSAVLNAIKNLFSIEVTIEDTQFLNDLKRSRVSIVKRAMTIILQSSNASQRGHNLFSLIQMHQEGLLDLESARDVMKSSAVSIRDYAPKFYLSLCLAEWLTRNKLSQFPTDLFDYTSALQFVSECTEECVSASVQSLSSVQQVADILSLPARKLLSICQISVFALKLAECFLNKSSDSLDRLKTLIDLKNYGVELVCRDLGRFLITGCCFLPSELALSGSSVEDFIMFCCSFLSNTRATNPLEPFASAELVSGLVLNVCCTAIEFWSTHDAQYKLISLLSGCNLVNYLVKLSASFPDQFSLFDNLQVLNTLLIAAVKIKEVLSSSPHAAASCCFELVLSTVVVVLESSLFLKRLNCSLIIANFFANLRDNVNNASHLKCMTKILDILLHASEDNCCQAIISELDVPKFTAEDSLCRSVFSALITGASVVKVTNAVFKSYSSFCINSSLKSSCWSDFIVSLEERLDKTETVEEQEKIVRVAKAFNEIATEGVIKGYREFDLSAPNSYTTLSGKLVGRGCLEHKNCLYSERLFIIKVLISSTFSNSIEEKEAAAFCLKKLLQLDSVKSTVKHAADSEFREICHSIASLGPICQENRVRRSTEWISQIGTFQDVIAALKNQQSPFSTWIKDFIKAIYRTHTLSDRFTLELQYLVGCSTSFCASAFYCVLTEFLSQASSNDVELFTQVLSDLLSSCQCEKRLRQITSFLLQLHSARMLNQTNRCSSALPTIEIPFLEASAAAVKLCDAYLAHLFLECHFSTVLTILPEAEPVLLTLVSHLANEDAVMGCQRLLSDYKKPLMLKQELLGHNFFESSEERKDFLFCCLQDFSVWQDPESRTRISNQNLPCALSTEGDFWSHLSLANQHILAGQTDSAAKILEFLDRNLSDFSQVHVDSNRLLFEFVEKRSGLCCLRRLLTVADSNSELQSLLSAFLSYAEERSDNFQFCKHYKTLAVHWNLNKTIIQLSQPDFNGMQQFLRHCFAFKDIFVSLKCTGRAQALISSLSEGLAQAQYNLPEFLFHLVKFEESSLYWETQEKDVALLLGKRCLKSLESLAANDRIGIDAYLNVVRRYSQWLNESKYENADSILEDYLLVAENKACSTNVSNSRLHYAIAEFSDAQYTSLQNYTKSPEFQAWCSVTKQSKENACELLRAGEKSRFTNSLNKQSRIDNDRITDIQQRKASYLVYTVTNLSKCLISGDAFDKSVYRFVELWLNNTDDQKVSEVVSNALKKVRLDKFIPLFPQLSARLLEGQEAIKSFQTTLSNFLGRVSSLHPHHTLYNLFALANANLDSKFVQRMQTTRTSLASGNPVFDRGKAAEKVINQVLRSSESSNRLVKFISRFCIAYVELANFQLPKDERSKSGTLTSLSTKSNLTAFQNVSAVHIPTVKLNVDAQGEYNNIVYAVKFLDKYATAGGINLPKIISIQCSDGITRRQLIKGNDDMRQDAVMQQVFNAVNRLLCDSPAASQRQLSLSTYHVIPMSQRSGIVEWCEGTMPISEYLAQGSKSAHVRYRPTDITPSAARTMMESSFKLSVKERIATYKDICSKLQPVFRHFFFERFVEPREFYLRRLTYTRSVAAWSMVGYVLGLGDRHLSNILVHNETASLFHIDLGVAFDQGRLLPTPETIPFRLTRDIVDGLGILGVEGDFRRACEITLELLRSSTNVILTICSILLHDPLYHWTLSPERANALQLNISKPRARFEPLAAAGDDSKEASVPQRSLMAERVMLRLREKLTGREDNFSLNVDGQVSYLIKQATDPRNLALVFHGWQPYL
ncbi:hypothetical protein BOX15_Mlig009488g1, partial [Macrostomum lignano]